MLSFAALAAVAAAALRSRRRRDPEDFDGRTLVVTRVHGARPPPADKIAAFCRAAAAVADGTLVVCAAPLAEAVRAAASGQADVDVLPLEPWGAFTPALNAAVAHAARAGYARVLFASAEACVGPEGVAALHAALNPRDVLVAGAVLPGHTHRPGRGPVPLGGRTVPWNTLAMWDVAGLACVGFPLVAEGLHAGVEAGVEEVSAVAVAQRLGLRRSAAVLLRVPGVAWEARWDGDPERARWHERKMASKEERPAGQMGVLGCWGGSCRHL